MPIIDPDEVKKNEQEFLDAFEESDEDRSKEAEVKPDTETDVSGEAQKDQTPVEEPAEATHTEDPIKAGVGQEPVTTDSLATENTALKQKVEDLETELSKERQKTSSWDGRIKAANQKAKDLEAEVKTLRTKLDEKDSKDQEAQDMSDKEKMDMFRTTFPELTDVVDILEKKIEKVRPAKAVEPQAKETEQEIRTEADTTVQTEPTDHYKTVTAAHKELDEIVNTGVLLTWINSQAAFMKDHLSDIYWARNGKGSSKQVIDMITEFKRTSGWKSQLDSGSTKSKAKEDKLKSMLETGDNSAGPKSEGPDKNDFEGTAKSIGL